MQKKYRIGYISQFNPLDRKASSGTTFKIAEALRNSLDAEITWIRIRHNLLYRIFDIFLKIINRMDVWKRSDFSHSITGAYLESFSLNKKAINKCDLLFAPFSSSALYFLKTNKPIIYLSDATFNIMVDYYFKKLSTIAIRSGNQIEQRAMNRASQIILSSDWAYQSAIKDYHQPKEKVHIIEFGANIDKRDIIKCEFHYNNHLNILFLGVDWERKGGAIAVEACQWLNAQGIKSTLHIVGIRKLDENIKKLPCINYVGFLNKNDPEQYLKLTRIIKESHCLLLPTLAECSAIAFCEASANGLPIFSHITGGTRNYITDGENGYLLPIGASGIDFGRKISECLFSGELERMSLHATKIYSEKLNWETWAQKTKTVIEQTISTK